MNIIDRRPNPKGKSLANRQRFIDRARGEVKRALSDALKRRKVGESEGGEKVSIPTRGITEPMLHRGVERRHGATTSLPGNKKFVVGDTIERPPSGEGGGRGSGSPDDGGEQDAFEFVLSKEEFLNLFFEDLELPDLVKTRLKESEATQLSRAGFSVAGTPANLNLVRTMRNSLARRISLRRPTPSEIAALQAANRRGAGRRRRRRRRTRRARPRQRATQGAAHRLSSIRSTCATTASSACREPNTQAVMFCLMDVSGSMTEAMKDLAKRFFLLLHVFLTRRYKHVDIVFIRHTTNAQEVDEETFFHSRETGGTIVSTALEEMMRVVRERYNPSTTGTSTPRRPPTATTTPRTAIAAASCWAARSCRSASTSPISRWAPRRRCGTASPRRRPISGAPTARSPPSTATSRCARLPIRHRSSRCSTSSSPSSGRMPEWS